LCDDDATTGTSVPTQRWAARAHPEMSFVFESRDGDWFVVLTVEAWLVHASQISGYRLWARVIDDAEVPGEFVVLQLATSNPVATFLTWDVDADGMLPALQAEPMWRRIRAARTLESEEEEAA